MKQFDVIIIGAGASGLMCAMTAAQRGRSILVLDSANKVGKKILMSGGGRCNFTNLDATPDNYLSHNPHFCKSALAKYTQWDFIGMVCDHQIEYHERDHGQLFCNDSSKQILSMLLTECNQANVEILTHCSVNTIQYNQSHYQLTTNKANYQCESLVIASGGLSIPKMGATDFGHKVAQQFGLDVYPCRAGLVPFTLNDELKTLSESLSGIAVPATISCRQMAFTENLLFTHRGLSGPVVLQISNYWQPGDDIHIDLLPSLDLVDTLLTQKQQQPKKRVRSVLTHYLPKKLVSEFESRYWPALGDTPLAEMSNKQLSQIANNLADWQLKPGGTEGYRTAEVTLGGVDTNAISSKTMEAISQPGLYFIGEVLDVTGHLGGYNFQWAWASGYVAGQSA